jgi:mannose-1-phosphate guanylyltransferase
VGRNTAPAIALACLSIDRDDLVLVTPSDHLVKDTVAYAAAVMQAKELALKNYLVTFGIKADYAETGFGYIEVDKKHGNNVLSFKEKPDIETAQLYVDASNYYWNVGMFCFKAGVFLDELQTHSVDLYQSCLNAFEQKNVSDCKT